MPIPGPRDYMAALHQGWPPERIVQTAEDALDVLHYSPWAYATLEEGVEREEEAEEQPQLPAREHLVELGRWIAAEDRQHIVQRDPPSRLQTPWMSYEQYWQAVHGMVRAVQSLMARQGKHIDDAVYDVIESSPLLDTYFIPALQHTAHLDAIAPYGQLDDDARCELQRLALRAMKEDVRHEATGGIRHYSPNVRPLDQADIERMISRIDLASGGNRYKAIAEAERLLDLDAEGVPRDAVARQRLFEIVRMLPMGAESEFETPHASPDAVVSGVVVEALVGWSEVPGPAPPLAQQPIAIARAPFGTYDAVVDAVVASVIAKHRTDPHPARFDEYALNEAYEVLLGRPDVAIAVLEQGPPTDVSVEPGDPGASIGWVLSDAASHILIPAVVAELAGRGLRDPEEEDAPIWLRPNPGGRPNPRYFHGSPHAGIETPRGTFFLTPDEAVAEQYAGGRLGASARGTQHTGATVYSVDVPETLRIFDMRRPDHRELYASIRERHNATSDLDDRLPSLASPGFIQSSTGLPGYGYTAVLALWLSPDFDGMLVDEGTQGVSLALFDPAATATIAGRRLLSRNPGGRLGPEDMRRWIVQVELAGGGHAHEVAKERRLERAAQLLGVKRDGTPLSDQSLDRCFEAIRLLQPRTHVDPLDESPGDPSGGAELRVDRAVGWAALSGLEVAAEYRVDPVERASAPPIDFDAFVVLLARSLAEEARQKGYGEVSTEEVEDATYSNQINEWPRSIEITRLAWEAGVRVIGTSGFGSSNVDLDIYMKILAGSCLNDAVIEELERMGVPVETT